MAAARRIVICGAAGRDFHNFNSVYRNDPSCDVVAFTATQIPGIDARRYPPALAGPHYPDGIAIVAEAELAKLIAERQVDEVVFAYSDVDYAQVMSVANRALAAGASFTLLGPQATMLEAAVPVIAVCAVRTGCGKSQVARYLTRALRERGLRTAAIRHPMPYGQLQRQAVQRFASVSDLDAADCTLEEREEYEPHIAGGGVVFAGVDYEGILERAQAEVDVIVWDGGNNDFSFIKPNLHIVVVDALRPDQLDTHYPGAAVLRTADLVVVNKVHAATSAQLSAISSNLDALLPAVPRVTAASPVTLEDPEAVRGARVLIVEDGPTITHGGMPHGAGYRAVRASDPAEIIDPRASATPSLREVYERFPHIGKVLPAMGYDPPALDALAATINASGAEAVVAGTPIDLARALNLDVPVIRASYRYQDAEGANLLGHVDDFLSRLGL